MSPQPGYPAPMQAPGYQAPAQPAPPPPRAQPAPPPPAPPAALPTGIFAPNIGDLQGERQNALRLFEQLKAALEPSVRQRLAQLPLVFDPKVGEVNAYASCTGRGKAVVSVTDTLLDLGNHLAAAASVDELRGTHKVDEYVQHVVRTQRPGAPLVSFSPGFFSGAEWNDPRRAQRQSERYDDLVAFVLGHELGHHALSHLPCTSALPLDASEIGVLASSVVPALNQPNELAADVAGMRNLLLVGRQRDGTPYSELGGLLLLHFFESLDNASPLDVFTFERTHPPPQLREPIVRGAAAAFRGGLPFRF